MRTSDGKVISENAEVDLLGRFDARPLSLLAAGRMAGLTGSRTAA